MTAVTPGLLPWENLDVFFDSLLAVTGRLSDGTEIRGIFTATSGDGGALGGPEFVVRQSDVDDYSVDSGTTIELDEQTYTVAGVQPDGTGTATLVLDPL